MRIFLLLLLLVACAPAAPAAPAALLPDRAARPLQVAHPPAY